LRSHFVNAGIWQWRATAVRSARRKASRFITGRAPGRPMQTGQVCVLGGAPNCVLHRQKSLVRVCN